MAREDEDFSGSKAAYPAVVGEAPSRALVTAPVYGGAPSPIGNAGAHGPEIISGGFNQTWLANCLRRRWLMAILLGLLSGVTVAGLLLWAFPEKSRVTSYLKVKSQSGNSVFNDQSERLSAQEIERQAMNHLALLKSSLVLDAAIQQQDIANLDAVRAHKGEEMLWLLDELRVTFPGDGEILEVKYEGEEDADQMVKVVDAVVKAYQDKVLFQERLLAVSTQDDLKFVLDDSNKRLESKLKELTARAESLGTLRQDVEIPQLSNEIRNLDSLIVKAQEELVNLEVFKELNVQNSRNSSMIEAAVAMELDKDPMIANYKEQIFSYESQLQAKRAASKNFASPEIKRLQSTLQSIQNQMAQYRSEAAAAMKDKYAKMPNETLRAAITEYNIRRQSAEANLAKYKQEAEAAREKLLALGVRNPDQEMLENNIESETEIVKSLQQRLMQWQVMNEAQRRRDAAGASSSFDKVTVIQPARALTATNRLERYSIAGIGGLAALALTCYGVALMEFRHRRLNGPADVDEGLGIRVLGIVPSTSLKALTGNSLVATQVAEAIDNVRATLMHDRAASGRQVIMVTSSGTMEGNTVVASSLALSLARAGRRTLLVDGDLRSPSLHKLFAMPLEDGLSEVLRSEIDLADAVKPTNNEGLYLLTGGVCNAEAIHALATDQPQAIFEKLRDQFDYIVIDAPPVLGISDSLSLGQYIDGAILTVLRDHTEIRKVYKAVEMLRGMGVRVLGSVVNGVPIKADRRVVRLHKTGASQAPRLTANAPE